MSNLIFVRETDDFQIFEAKKTLLQEFVVKENGLTKGIYKMFGKIGDTVFMKGEYALDLEKTPLRITENSGFLNVSFDLKNAVFNKLK